MVKSMTKVFLSEMISMFRIKVGNAFPLTSKRNKEDWCSLTAENTVTDFKMWQFLLYLKSREA